MPHCNFTLPKCKRHYRNSINMYKNGTKFVSTVLLEDSGSAAIEIPSDGHSWSEISEVGRCKPA